MPLHIKVNRDGLAEGEHPQGFVETEDYVEQDGMGPLHSCGSSMAGQASLLSAECGKTPDLCSMNENFQAAVCGTRESRLNTSTAGVA